MRLSRENRDLLERNRVRIKIEAKGYMTDLFDETFTEALKYLNENLDLPISPDALQSILVEDSFMYSMLNLNGLRSIEEDRLHQAVSYYYMNEVYDPNDDDFDIFNSHLRSEILKKIS